MKKFFWWTFEDGYSTCARGLSKTEIEREALKHGKLIKVEKENKNDCTTKRHGF